MKPPVWQDYPDDVTAFTKTLTASLLYYCRKESIERSFADAKDLHGMRNARCVGLRNMREQSVPTAAVQHIKKIAWVCGEHPSLPPFVGSFHRDYLP